MEKTKQTLEFIKALTALYEIIDLHLHPDRNKLEDLLLASGWKPRKNTPTITGLWYRQKGSYITLGVAARDETERRCDIIKKLLVDYPLT